MTTASSMSGTRLVFGPLALRLDGFVEVERLGRVRFLPGRLTTGRGDGSWRHGPRFTDRNCSAIGSSCNRASRQSRSNHSGSL